MHAQQEALEEQEMLRQCVEKQDSAQHLMDLLCENAALKYALKMRGEELERERGRERRTSGNQEKDASLEQLRQDLQVLREAHHSCPGVIAELRDEVESARRKHVTCARLIGSLETEVFELKRSLEAKDTEVENAKSELKQHSARVLQRELALMNKWGNAHRDLESNLETLAAQVRKDPEYAEFLSSSKAGTEILESVKLQLDVLIEEKKALEDSYALREEVDERNRMLLQENQMIKQENQALKARLQTVSDENSGLSEELTLLLYEFEQSHLGHAASLLPTDREKSPQLIPEQLKGERPQQTTHARATATETDLEKQAVQLEEALQAAQSARSEADAESAAAQEAAIARATLEAEVRELKEVLALAEEARRELIGARREELETEVARALAAAEEATIKEANQMREARAVVEMEAIHLHESCALLQEACALKDAALERLQTEIDELRDGKVAQVELEGQAVNCGVSYHGQEARDLENLIKQHEDEKEALHKAAAVLQDEVDLLQKQTKGLEEALKQLGDASDSSRRTLENRIKKVEGESSKAREELAASIKTGNNLQGELDKLRKQGICVGRERIGSLRRQCSECIHAQTRIQRQAFAQCLPAHMIAPRSGNVRKYGRGIAPLIFRRHGSSGREVDQSPRRRSRLHPCHQAPRRADPCQRRQPRVESVESLTGSAVGLTSAAGTRALAGSSVILTLLGLAEPEVSRGRARDERRHRACKGSSRHSRNKATLSSRSSR